MKECMSISIVAFKPLFIFPEVLPDFHQRKEAIASNRPLRRENP